MRVDAHQKTMKDTWKKIEDIQKTRGLDVDVDMKDAVNAIDDYILKNPALESTSPDDFKRLIDMKNQWSKL